MLLLGRASDTMSLLLGRASDALMLLLGRASDALRFLLGRVLMLDISIGCVWSGTFRSGANVTQRCHFTKGDTLLSNMFR